MGEAHYTKKKKETAVLIGLINQEQTNLQTKEYLEELDFLARTAGVETIKIFTQQLDNPNPKTFIGKGKLEQIKDFVEEEDIDLIIFDDELSPSQLRNIERVFERKILDRTHLILDIFADRARTAHAKVQVELAQYQYLLPRLTRMWTHLQKQKGGSVGMRGPGETEIETDRRIIRDKITRLKEQLKRIDKQKATQRKNRAQMIRVALVGYTNAGKSTVMNVLSKSDILAENKLFATLDTTVRKVVIENLPFLLSDTVGFIRKLPHNLVESFKSTLDEVRESDILIHVVDISHHNFEEQIQIVNETLQEIDSSEKSIFLVFNKIDQFTYEKKDEDDLTPKSKENYSLEELQTTWMAKENHNTLFISAKEKTNIDKFKKMLYDEVRKLHIKRYPYNHFLYPDYEE